MSNYRLYIQGKLVDLQDDGVILFQKQRTDYTNPTIVKNSFTKTITLPATKNNNEVFNSIWKLDRVQWDGAFNASQRTPFILFKDGNLVEKGYVKLDNVIWTGDFYKFDITLYGELGNILYALTYNIDEETYETTPMTLSVLDWGFEDIKINKELIKDAWDRLEGDDTKPEIYDALNFIVSYDGIPNAKNFDAKKMWVSTLKVANVIWDDTNYPVGSFPETITKDGTTYIAQPENVPISQPQDKYGLMELPKDISPLEARDFRSYLMRPVINIKQLFLAIGRYIKTNYDYDIDLSDPFFSSEEFNNLWMTLTKFDKLVPEIESNYVMSKETLFSTTSAPSSYLISICKIYGIYLDVDLVNKTLKLNRLPNFFNGKVKDIMIDKDKEIKITPLSFDKATYTFDYGDGSSEFLKSYKDKYGKQYGSKFVNTGYRFDASTAPYIQNNIFKQGVDSLDQSIYYRYNVVDKGAFNYNYPIALANGSETNIYKLFNTSGDEIQEYSGEMYNIFNYYPNSGYQFINEKWIGSRSDVWQDGFPKLQLHSADNKGEEGKDILVHFNGFLRTKYGRKVKTEVNAFVRDGDEFVEYLISDDNIKLKNIIGKNCYFDNQYPDKRATKDTYLIQIDSIPSFSRAIYDYTSGKDDMPVFIATNFMNYSTSAIGMVSVDARESWLKATFQVNTQRQYPTISVEGIKENHRYAIFAGLRCEDPSMFLMGENDYLYPEIAGGTVISHKDMGPLSSIQLVGSVVEMGQFITIPTRLRMPSSVNNLREGEYYILFVVVYDLTEMGIETTDINEIIAELGVSPQRLGYQYNMTKTLDFAISKEIFVPATKVSDAKTIYDEYWKDYVRDVYNVNTKIFEAYCYLDDINEAFREFYFYDNTLWILSKVVDWDATTKLCKGIFTKVNDRTNYIS